MKPEVDYSLYLVTDSTPAILGHRDLCDVVEQAVAGGVTVVQYRDKTSDTGALIETGRKLHKICKAGGVPLIINDRVDVALAVDCEGVHLGQDDMELSTARAILGRDKIIGISVSTVEEARVAVEQGADYLGIGTIYATSTKKNTKNIMGIGGLRHILMSLANSKNTYASRIPTVCIGGINNLNVQLVRFQSASALEKTRRLDGVAVVSVIMAAERPTEAAKELKRLIREYPPFAWKPVENANFEHEKLRQVVQAVQEKRPLSHNMTNLVVQHFAASVALAIGASPIMSNQGTEAADLALLKGGLVINMGTSTSENLRNQCQAITQYNRVGAPIVLDPVGAAATSHRREALRTLLNAGYFALIKGNEAEIVAVAEAVGLEPSSGTQQHGVDSHSSLTSEQKVRLVQQIAAREQNVVLMTGKSDFISDGKFVLEIKNGHEYLGMVTGSGCALGTTLAAYIAAYPDDRLLAAVAGILHYEIAAEQAVENTYVQGPGTFIPAFIDALYRCGKDYEYAKWLEGAAIYVYDDSV